MSIEMERTMIKANVHHKGHSPIFSETRTEVEVIDEAGGPFISLKQEEGACIKLDYPEEAEKVWETMKELMENFPKEEMNDA